MVDVAWLWRLILGASSAGSGHWWWRRRRESQERARVKQIFLELQELPEELRSARLQELSIAEPEAAGRAAALLSADKQQSALDALDRPDLCWVYCCKTGIA